MTGPTPPLLGIVIPTLDAGPRLDATLAALGEAGFPMEVVVADGGSTDDTAHIAARHGAKFLQAPPGRGAQLAAGAAAVAGQWLMFLHADTVPAAGWAEEVAGFMADTANRRRAAVFRFALDDRAAAARRIERLVAWRCRTLGLPYGDQGLILGRAFYDDLGGYRPLPLMEDVDMARRIGRGRLAFLETAAVTSAERYRRGGYIVRPLRNLACLGLYFLGVAPRFLARLYR